MIDEFLRVLYGRVDADAAEIADALWLSGFMPDPTEGIRPGARTGGGAPVPVTEPPGWPGVEAAGFTQAPSGKAAGEVTVHLAAGQAGRESGGHGTPAGIPAVAALPAERKMLRALRPLRGRVTGFRGAVIDEEATAQRIAEDGLWLPSTRPAAERWLNLALMVDVSASMVIWRQAVAEFTTLLQRLGAFQDIRVWRLDGDAGTITSGVSDRTLPVGRHPRELLDPAGRRLVIVISDCIGGAWTGSAIPALLEKLGRAGPVVIAQPLPQRLWSRSRLNPVLTRLHTARRGMPNSTLDVARRDESLGPLPPGVPIPVIQLDPRWIDQWSRLVAAGRSGWTMGAAYFTRSGSIVQAGAEADGLTDPGGMSALERVTRFRAGVSPTAFHLATALAAAPLNLPVMRLVQRAMLPTSRPEHLAEVFLSGILRRTDSDVNELGVVAYDFHDGVREVLLAATSRADTLRVLRAVSSFLEPRLGAAFDFRALLHTGEEGQVPALTRPFAAVARAALRAVGGEYAQIADRLGETQEHAAAHASPGSPAAGGDLTATIPALGALAGQELRRDARDGLRVPAVGSSRGGTVTLPSSEDMAREVPVLEQPAVWGDVPPRNPSFTGREELLLQLRRQLQSRMTALLPHALHGMGGVGKTQLAIEYAYRFATDYQLVWWVPAAEIAMVRAALADLAPLLDLPATGDVTQRVQAVREALRQGKPYRRWLVVFDNADNPADLRSYLPYASGHILITSRNQEWVAAAQTLEVDVFSRDESIRLIQSRGRGISDSEADRLAEALGDLPIAVGQASAWQAETGMSVDEYLGLLKDRMSQLLSESPPNYPLPVVAAWQLAFDELAKRTPAAAQLLELCAFIGPEPVSFRLLSAGRYLPDLPSPLAEATRDEILLGRTIREISRYALARIEPIRRSLQLHRLVQGVLRERLAPEQRRANQQLVYALLAAANPGDPDDVNNWDRLADISGHVSTTGIVEADTPEARRVVLDQIRYRYVLGDYESSKELGEATVLRWWDRYGADDELTLIALRHLGNSWRALGMLDVARAYNRDTLDRMRRVFGDDHEHTLFAANSYGADLRNAGAYAEARALDEDNYQKHVQRFGEDDLFTLRSANNLAVDLRLAGEFHPARQRDEDILQRRKRVLGDDHPDTLYAQIQLSRDIRGLGDNEEALRIQEETLPMQIDQLGPTHLNVLSTRLAHAVTLRRVGRLEDARTEAEHCLNAYNQTFGEKHAGTVAATWILADILRTLALPEEAAQLAERAVHLANAIYDRRHIFRALYANNYAIALRGMEHYEQARTIDEAALADITAIVGTDHPYALSSAANVASSHYFTGNVERARELSEIALERTTRVRGPEHPATIFCMHNLAMDVRATGNDVEAHRIASEALDRLRARLGATHPDFVATAGGRRYDFDIEPPTP